jgi:hypothetical protein
VPVTAILGVTTSGSGAIDWQVIEHDVDRPCTSQYPMRHEKVKE